MSQSLFEVDFEDLKVVLYIRAKSEEQIFGSYNKQRRKSCR